MTTERSRNLLAGRSINNQVGPTHFAITMTAFISHICSKGHLLGYKVN